MPNGPVAPDRPIRHGKRYANTTQSHFCIRNDPRADPAHPPSDIPPALPSIRTGIIMRVILITTPA
ncbi:hypothetical protein RC1_0334 [Rhodospirillum centenum SW]|uniref:Uncharacterized protein n=1 Tax=Rhodospirillum centenum (strain ATCC 51521 / SW) TaxID=414684 RepID=B6IQP6_RHOCS|nr:hypothetical protein RC1_0334 [Rhodospirillum centenum SW]